MEVRRIAILVVVLALMAIGAAPASAASLASVSVKDPGTDPLADAAAATRVNETRWEPRTNNAQENQRRPSDEQLEDFRRRSEMVNRGRVTGHYRGTTDEILQWAARKWGFDPDLFRAVAAVESNWNMSAVGDGGLSFGLFQMKRTYHCCLPLSSKYTAFNADYYGAILRAYYDGRQKWLNDVERGERYDAGDLWGSVGSWYAGRWRTAAALDYIRRVQHTLRDEPWRERWF
jgi:Transglycosylase SLT domain